MAQPPIHSTNRGFIHGVVEATSRRVDAHPVTQSRSDRSRNLLYRTGRRRAPHFCVTHPSKKTTFKIIRTEAKQPRSSFLMLFLSSVPSIIYVV